MTRKRFLQILSNVFYALGIVVSILFLIIYAFGVLYNDDYHSQRDTEMLTSVYMALAVFAPMMLMLCLAVYRCNGVRFRIIYHNYHSDTGQHFYRCEQVVNGAVVENSEFLIEIYNDGRFNMEMLNNTTNPTRFITIWDKDKGEEIPYEFKINANKAQSILKKYLRENRAEVLERCSVRPSPDSPAPRLKPSPGAEKRSGRWNSSPTAMSGLTATPARLPMFDCGTDSSHEPKPKGLISLCIRAEAAPASTSISPSASESAVTVIFTPPVKRPGR